MSGTSGGGWSSSTAGSMRFHAISEINNRTPKRFDPPRDEAGKRQKISDFFGQSVFDFTKMEEKLPKAIFNKLIASIQIGKKLESDVADVVAKTVKEWAMSKGVTHYTH
ncbi:MAG: glutamine synthetase III, partial [Bdellovibrionota bacterium]